MKNLLNTYTKIVRPVLEYAAPIWAPASSSSKEKIDTVQYRASKIIIGAVSSTNNLSAEIECGLTPLLRAGKNWPMLNLLIRSGATARNTSQMSFFGPGPTGKG
ncbi:uncharacterized protein TNCV_153801 [Trichonephila clavipes]|nr:uncharacterized protein TNCV_153801 [Trichonephila clavipes]